MFSLLRRFPWFRKLAVILFSLPLMFAGGSLLGGLAHQQSVGEVGTFDIPRDEFISRYRQIAEEYRRSYGVEELPPEAAQQVMQQVQSDLLSSYLFRASIEKKGLSAPDYAVAEEIRSVPDFQDEDGEFSLALYNEFIRDRRYYEEQVRRSVSRAPLLRPTTGVIVEHVRDELAAFRRQQRLIDEAVAPISVFSTVTLDISSEDINLYYQRNSEDYALREEADFEYFIFELDEFAADYTVSAEEVETAYEDFIADLGTLERRRISHIYLSDEDRAEEVFAIAEAAPEQFADFAREYSEDAGSADLGGNLGIISDGDLPEEMNEAVITMTAGQLHPPLEVDDGYSILKVEDIIAETPPAFDDIRADMEQQARRAAALEDFESRVEELREQAHIEIGSLLAMANAVSVSVTVAVTVTRAATENDYPFNDEAVLIDVFDSLVIADGENSPPIILADDDYLFARSRRYQAAGLTPLPEVAEEIVTRLRAEYVVGEMYQEMEAAFIPAALTATTATASTVATPVTATDLTVAAGEEEEPSSSLLERLDTVDWSASHTVLLAGEDDDSVGLNLIDDGADADGESFSGSRSDEEDGGLDERTIDIIFSADLTNGLPTYVFLPEEENIRIYRIREVIAGEPQAEDFAVVDELMSSMKRRLAGAGYLDALSGQYEFEFYDLPAILPGAEQPVNSRQ